jgi:hypothetical protein
MLKVMKRYLRKITLITGIIVALFALSNVDAIAGSGDTSDTDEKLEAQFKEVIEKILEKDHVYVSEISYKIYDQDYDLVYESTNRQDPKLMKLINRSDFLLNINTSRYYLLDNNPETSGTNAYTVNK